MAKQDLSFKPKQVAGELLEGLPDRSRQVIKKRFGLDKKKHETLEAVGQSYGITRERVRQIEDFTLKTIKKSPAFARFGAVFSELGQAMEDYGGVVHEREFLAHLTSDEVLQNNIHFLLVLGDAFSKLREDDHFHHRWTTDGQLAKAVHESLRGLARKLGQDDLLPEEQLIELFLKNVHSDIPATRAERHAPRWIRLSKEIGRSPVGEWGLARSPNVKVRGIRDYAFLVMRREGKPMHFTDVAKAITQSFGKKANPATSHNELIKDNRFVLVGRGIYALAEWGYTPGIVRDVIREVLKKYGPLTKDDVLKRVLESRLVKPNTVLVNLKNPRYFREDKSGRFTAI